MTLERDLKDYFALVFVSNVVQSCHTVSFFWHMPPKPNKEPLSIKVLKHEVVRPELLYFYSAFTNPQKVMQDHVEGTSQW